MRRSLGPRPRPGVLPGCASNASRLRSAELENQRLTRELARHASRPPVRHRLHRGAARPGQGGAQLLHVLLARRAAADGLAAVPHDSGRAQLPPAARRQTSSSSAVTDVRFGPRQPLHLQGPVRGENIRYTGNVPKPYQGPATSNRAWPPGGGGPAGGAVPWAATTDSMPRPSVAHAPQRQNRSPNYESMLRQQMNERVFDALRLRPLHPGRQRRAAPDGGDRQSPGGDVPP